MKKSLLQGASMIWLTASVMSAQGPNTTETPRFDWRKAQVKVVYAPEYSRRPDSPESRILSAIKNGRTKNASTPVEFAAPLGLTGVRLGPESAIAATVTIGDDGKRQVGCEHLFEALETVKKASSVARTRKEGDRK